ncbi:MAG: FecR domain-containing protein [Candidatus Cloacimonetes bacterium]|nr:FecR domain-containing protein [Candidatus Cloacimonadota bacterium]
MKSLPILFPIFLIISTLSYTQEHIAEFAIKKGRVFVTGPENKLISNDRGFYTNSFVKVEDNAFALLKYKTGDQVKITEHSVFKGVSLKRKNTIGLQLLKGQYFFNLLHENRPKPTEFEIMTPMGTIESSNGDFLIHVDEQRGFLEVFCLDGKLNLRFQDLQIILEAGESAFVENDRISRKLSIDAAQSRRLFSWYRLESSWPIPVYLRDFSESYESETVHLRDFTINGLTVEEMGDNPTFGSADLIMGKLRFEGTIENRLPHQILQMSLDEGNNFFDVVYKEGFLVKRFPKEGQYSIQFRLRDFDKFYDVKHNNLDFSYSERGNKDFIENWLSELSESFKRKNAFRLSNVLRPIKNVSRLIVEDLMQEFREVSHQSIHFEILRYMELKNKLQIVVKFNKITTTRSNLEAIKESGTFRILFKQDSKLGFTPKSLTGDFPFIKNYSKNRVDYRGPKVIGSFIVTKVKGANTVVNLTAEDETSIIKRVEYFLDSTSSDGRGIKVLALDGKFDERLEQFRILLRPGFRNYRLFVHAQDSRGNWGKFHAISFVD